MKIQSRVRKKINFSNCSRSFRNESIFSWLITIQSLSHWIFSCRFNFQWKSLFLRQGLWNYKGNAKPLQVMPIPAVPASRHGSGGYVVATFHFYRPFIDRWMDYFMIKATSGNRLSLQTAMPRFFLFQTIRLFFFFSGQNGTHPQRRTGTGHENQRAQSRRPSPGQTAETARPGPRLPPVRTGRADRLKPRHQPTKIPPTRGIHSPNRGIHAHFSPQ